MRGGPYFGGMPCNVLVLIALALGYIVCVLASKEGKGLKWLGYIIGIVIIAVSASLIIMKFLGSMSGGCPFGKYPKMPMPMMQEKMMREQAPSSAPKTAPCK